MEALAVAAAATKAVGSIVQGEHQASMLNMQGDAADRAASLAAAQGYAREDVVRRSNAQKLGAQYAAIAQSGVDPNSGSALNVLATSGTNLEYDALSTRYQGLAQRDQFLQQRNNLRVSARNARTGGYLEAGIGVAQSALGYAQASALGGPAKYYGAPGGS